MGKFIVVRSDVVGNRRQCFFEQELHTIEEIETFKSIVNQEFSELHPLHADLSLGTLYFCNEEIVSPPKHRHPFIASVE